MQRGDPTEAVHSCAGKGLPLPGAPQRAPPARPPPHNPTPSSFFHRPIDVDGCHGGRLDLQQRGRLDHSALCSTPLVHNLTGICLPANGVQSCNGTCAEARSPKPSQTRRPMLATYLATPSVRQHPALSDAARSETAEQRRSPARCMRPAARVSERHRSHLIDMEMPISTGVEQEQHHVDCVLGKNEERTA